MAGKQGTAFATFDGATAQAFIYERAEKKLRPLPGFPMTGKKKPDFESSRGRVFESVGDRRSAAEPSSDPEKLLEREFVEQVAAALDALRVEGAFRQLLVAAGPRALGYWRDVASDALRDAVKKEVDSNYANANPNDLIDIVEEKLWD